MYCWLQASTKTRARTFLENKSNQEINVEILSKTLGEASPQLLFVEQPHLLPLFLVLGVILAVALTAFSVTSSILPLVFVVVVPAVLAVRC